MNHGGIAQYPPPKEEKPQPNVVGWIGAVSGVGGFVLTLYRDSAQPQSGWLRYVAEGLLGLAVIIGICVGWSMKISPIFARRKVLKKAKTKAEELKGFVRRYLSEVVAENSDISIFHAARSPGGVQLGTAMEEKTKTARYHKETAEHLSNRLKKPFKVLEDIELAFATFDSLVRNFGYDFKDWRNHLVANWSQVSEHSQNHLAKAREVYNKFVGDYNNLRQMMEKAECGVGAFTFQLPDVFPAPTPRQPQVPAQ